MIVMDSVETTITITGAEITMITIIGAEITMDIAAARAIILAAGVLAAQLRRSIRTR